MKRIERLEFAINEIIEGRVTVPVSRQTFSPEECEMLDRVLAYKRSGMRMDLIKGMIGELRA